MIEDWYSNLFLKQIIKMYNVSGKKLGHDLSLINLDFIERRQIGLDSLGTS